MQNKTDHAIARSLTKKQTAAREIGRHIKKQCKEKYYAVMRLFKKFFCNLLLVDAYPNIQRLSHMYRMYI